MSVIKVTAAALAVAASLGLTLASAAVDPHAGHAAAAAVAPPATPASAKAATPAPAAAAPGAAGAATPTTTPAAAKALTPAPPPAAAVDPAQGRELFTNWSCGSCHALADAGGTGHVGPAFDGNPSLTQALVVDRVTNGQGAMPAFGGQMTDAEIATIAKYITQFAAK